MAVTKAVESKFGTVTVKLLHFDDGAIRPMLYLGADERGALSFGNWKKAESLADATGIDEAIAFAESKDKGKTPKGAKAVSGESFAPRGMATYGSDAKLVSHKIVATEEQRAEFLLNAWTAGQTVKEKQGADWVIVPCDLPPDSIDDALPPATMDDSPPATSETKPALTLGQAVQPASDMAERVKAKLRK